jgi:hypothetical protein
MALQILLFWIDFGSFLIVAARIFVLATMFSTMVIHNFGSPATSIRLLSCFSLACLYWYFINGD